MTRPRLDDLDRRILGLALPALGGLAAEPAYILVDTAIVGRLGTVPLGGLALAATVLTTLLWVFNFLSFGTTSRVGHFVGAGDQQSAARVGVQAVWLCLAIGVPLAVVVAAAGRPLAAALGGTGAVLDAAVTYLRISAIGIPSVLLVIAGHGIFRGYSDTRTPFVIVAASNVANVILEVVFVYVLDMGIGGSAWGTVLAQTGAAIALVGPVLRRATRAEVTLRPAAAEMLPLVAIGRHLFIRTGALLAALALATSAAARVDASTLAAHQITHQLFIFLAYFVDALAVAAQAMVATAIGAASLGTIRATTARLLRHGVLLGALLTVLLLAVSPVLPRVFTGDGAVAGRASTAIAVLALMQVPAAIAFVLDGVLMGASDFAFVKWTTVAGLVSFIPFAAAVIAWPGTGIALLWAGLFVWISARGAVAARRYANGQWLPAAAIRGGV